tara:strand:- start:3 stop:611 length:609 start_codon:yes stop_codon:yes gene_type:complete
MSTSPENGNGNGSATAVAEWVIRWRWLVLIGSVAIGLIAGSGGERLAFNNDYRVFFAEDNPELLAFEQLQRTYTKIDNVLFAIAPRDGEVFTPEVLDAVEVLTLEAWQLPYALRVDSITNYQHTIATDDDLVVADLEQGSLSWACAGVTFSATMTSASVTSMGPHGHRDLKWRGGTAPKHNRHSPSWFPTTTCCTRSAWICS